MAKLLLLLLATSFNLISSNGEAQRCLTHENTEGVCIRFFSCQKAVSDYQRGIYPTLCSNWDNNLVCCADRTSINQVSTNKRISQQKCAEYSKLSKNVALFSGLSLGTSQVEKIESYTCELSTSLIVGGQVTKPGEFPHMAALGWRKLDGDYAFNCGGSLISEQFVLTAAHCEFFNRQHPQIVRLGDQNLKSRLDKVRELDMPVGSFIRHEQYDSRQKKNDIALVKLRYPITKWQKNIRPACIWSTQELKSDKVVATGFGSVGYGEDNSDELLKVQLSVYHTQQCGGAIIDDTQICAGDTHNNGDTCQGDSGGPLQATLANDKCTFHIIGITSYGSAYCGYEPAVYTRVSAYVDWIEQKVWG